MKSHLDLACPCASPPAPGGCRPRLPPAPYLPLQVQLVTMDLGVELLSGIPLQGRDPLWLLAKVGLVMLWLLAKVGLVTLWSQCMRL